MLKLTCGTMRVRGVNKLTSINTIKTCRALSCMSFYLKDNNNNVHRAHETEHNNVKSGSINSTSDADCDPSVHELSKGEATGRGRKCNSKDCNSEANANINDKSEYKSTDTSQRNEHVKHYRKLSNSTERKFTNSSPQISNNNLTNELQGNTSHVRGDQKYYQQRNKLSVVNFEKYISHEDCSEGLKRGELIQGCLRIPPRMHKNGYLEYGTNLRDIRIEGREMRNRALPGDEIVVKLLPKDEWRKNDAGKGDTEDLDDSCFLKTGKVVHIIEKKHPRVTSGRLKPFRDHSYGFALVYPVDHRIPLLMIPLSECPTNFKERPRDFENTLFVARITSWGSNMPFAEGKLMRNLGESGHVEPETEAIIMRNNIDSSEFQDNILHCLPDSDTWEITREELLRRKDLRNECIFTIDPSTARDLDDALSCKKVGEDLYEVGVHIADVSHFIEQDNVLDEVAKKRATSVYLVQRAIPMLPKVLCEQLCSLNPGVERLAYSVMWNLKSDGTIVSEWFGRTVIKSCIKLSYDHAQRMIESSTDDIIQDQYPPVYGGFTLKNVSQIVKQLYAISADLRKERFDSGALKIDMPKLEFTLDDESGAPNGCRVYEYKKSNEMIEEFMLLANMAVAKKIYEAHPKISILRQHPPPEKIMMQDLSNLCKVFDVPFDIRDSTSINASLRKIIESHPETYEYIYPALTLLCIKPFQNAKYFCTGSIENEKHYHHYGLNVPMYTHFTSPIRRYPDIMVHRLLTASLDSTYKVNDDVKQLQKIADHCNDKKWAAKRASDESSLLFFTIYVKECGPIAEKGVVVGIFDNAINVLSLHTGIVSHIYTGTLSISEHDFTSHELKPQMTLYWQGSSNIKKGTLTERLAAITKHFEGWQTQNENKENEMCEEDENGRGIDEGIIKQELTIFSPVDLIFSVKAEGKILATLSNPHDINESPAHGL